MKKIRARKELFLGTLNYADALKIHKSHAEKAFDDRNRGEEIVPVYIISCESTIDDMHVVITEFDVDREHLITHVESRGYRLDIDDDVHGNMYKDANHLEKKYIRQYNAPKNDVDALIKLFTADRTIC